MPRIVPPPRRKLRPVPAPNRKRWTRRECAFLVQNELLTERYELIDGEVIFKMGQKRSHAITVMLLTGWLMRLFGDLYVQCQLPINVAEDDNETNEPEPDVTLLVEPITSYVDESPGPDDCLLVIEVSDTTLRFDLQTKALLYARAGIGEYWVVDIAGRRLIAHRQPGPEGYREVMEYVEEDAIAPSARLDSPVLVRELLPPRRAARPHQG